jgi:hypothetical protein
MALALATAQPGQGQPAAPALPTWLAGCWAGDVRGTRVEERWIDADRDTLLGVGTTVAGGRLREFEFLRIVVDGGALAYLAQPGGAPPTRFAATSSGPAEVVFENPQHDFPKRVGYQRTGDRLLAWIDGGAGGEGTRREFPMRKAPCER